jgi:hypothetical protein
MTHIYEPMKDTRAADEIAADRAALPLFLPGTAIRHVNDGGHWFPEATPVWTATVIRTFVDDAGEWVEMLDNYGNVGAGRPSAWELINDANT